MSASPASNASRHIRFEIQLVALSVLLLLSLGALLSALVFTRLEATTRRAVDATFISTSRAIQADLARRSRLLEGALTVTAASPLARERTSAARRARVATLIELFSQVRGVVASYIGYPDGTYLYVRLIAPLDRAPVNAVYLVRELDRSAGPLRARRYFLDAQRRPFGEGPEREDLIDPRNRPWFTSAPAGRMALGALYRLGSSHQLGFTASARGASGSVAAVSLGLVSLSQVLEDAAPTPGTEIALVDGRGDVDALSDRKQLDAATVEHEGLPTITSIGIPQLAAVAARISPKVAHATGTVRVAGIGEVHYRVDATPRTLGPNGRLIVAIPESELSAKYSAIRSSTMLFSALILLLGMGAAWWIGRSIAQPLVRMTRAADALEQLDFSPHPIPPSGVREIDALAATFEAMRTRLLQFTELSAALAEGQDLHAILERTLAEIVVSIGADAGVAYIAQTNGAMIPIAASGLPAVPRQAPPAGGFARHAANAREPLQLHVDVNDPTLGDAFASLGTDVPLRVLALPFVSHGGDLVALVLAARRREPERPFPEPVVAYGRSFAGATALALEAQRYLDDLERFNDAAACFVPSPFLEQIECSDISAMQLGDYRLRPMTVLSSDIRSFTTISEELGVERTFEFLTAYLRAVGPGIRDAGGFVDRYVGDAIVALFPGRPADAVTAAVNLQAAVRAFNANRPAWLERPIAAGTGVDTGIFTLGTIGENERYATAAISPAAGRADIIESRTVFFGAPILVSEDVAAQIEGERPLRRLPLAAPEGEPALRLFEVLDGDDGALREQKRAHLDGFAGAVALFDAGRYDDAAEAFGAIARDVPGDLTAARMRDYSSARSPSHSGHTTVAS